MERVRPGDDVRDPRRISGRAELGAALRRVKGAHTYADLHKAAQGLIVRAKKTGGPSSWAPEPLVKGTVSDWLAGRSLPSQNKLLTFLSSCGVPREEWSAWVDAVARARTAPQGRTIFDHNPLRLGIHRAIHVTTKLRDDAGNLDLLTPYVIRGHDHELREILRTGRRNQLVVLVGGSSVGKTRACYEAVCDVLPGWPVIHPATSEELLILLRSGIEPGTVLWLNETQRYLQPPLGRDVAVELQRLVTDASVTDHGRIVVLGSMWLNPYWQTFTRLPQPGEPDEHAHVRDLLTISCQRVYVADDFYDLTAEQRAILKDLAERDSRLKIAVATGGDRLPLTQIIAGGPQLLQHYFDLQTTNPLAHALLTVAMDCHRIGYQHPLTYAVLERASAGYLSSEQRAAPYGWLQTALDASAQEIYGLRALAPIRTDETINHADAFVLHDYLSQYAFTVRRRDRKRQFIPFSLWEALVNYAGADDLRELGLQAQRRGLYRYAFQFYKVAAQAGDITANRYAAVLLRAVGRVDESIVWLRRIVEAGDVGAYGYATTLLREAGRTEEAITWFQIHAEDGDPTAYALVATLLRETGRTDEAIAWFERAAENGDDDAPGYIADLLQTAGRPEEAIIWLQRGAELEYFTAQKEATALLRAQPDRGKLALSLFKARGEAGDTSAYRLAGALLKAAGRREEAISWFQRAAEAGDTTAYRKAGALLREAGRRQEAISWFQRAAEAGDTTAYRQAGALLWVLGRMEEAISWLQRGAEAGDAPAYGQAAALMARSGRVQEAVTWLQRHAEAGDNTALEEAIELLRVVRRTDQALTWLQTCAENGAITLSYAAHLMAHTLRRPEETITWIQARAADHHLDADTMEGLGDLLEEAKRPEEAIKWYQLCVQADTSQIWAHMITCHVAERLESSGRLDEAIIWYMRAANNAVKGYHLMPAPVERAFHLLARAGRIEEATSWLRACAEAGTIAFSNAASLMHDLGRTQEATTFLWRAAEVGDHFSIELGADLLEDLGHPDAAAQLRCYGLEPGGEIAHAWAPH